MKKYDGRISSAAYDAGYKQAIEDMQSGKLYDIDKEQAHSQISIVYALHRIKNCVEQHYNYPIIAPNGKAEGLCLVLKGLEGIIYQLTHPKKICKLNK